MDRNRVSSSELLKLRRRAEGVIRTTPDVLSTLPKKELQHLMQELQVYQVELDMQNEELRRANVELENARTKYSLLYEFAPSGYLTLAADGTILEANLTAARLLGVERRSLLQGRLALFVTSTDRPLLAAHLEQVLAGGHKETCEVDMLRSGGARWQARLESTRAQETVEPTPRCWVILIDITTRHQAQEQIAHLNADLAKQVKAYETVVQKLEQSQGDLQDKNADLERFYDAVVGRELKMIEMENELVELKRQLQGGKTEP
ncbi:MAG: PAS domain S-box protein [Nitrospirota bacterium]|nr:PAS domain S-box protein [Nitrospirota bacterium]